MKNDYKIVENIVEIYITKKNGDKFTLLIDLEDLEKVKRYTWCVTQKKKRLYALCRTKSQIVYIHQYILNYDNPLTCDHINLNGLDNRKSNLRICTNGENNRNKPLQKNNTSGVTGIYFHKKNKNWIVQINVNGKPKNFGSFLNKEEAIKKREQLKKEYHGEYAFKTEI